MSLTICSCSTTSDIYPHGESARIDTAEQENSYENIYIDVYFLIIFTVDALSIYFSYIFLKKHSSSEG